MGPLVDSLFPGGGDRDKDGNESGDMMAVVVLFMV